MANERKKCLIIGSGPMGDGASLEAGVWQDAEIICADGGLDMALQKGILPNLVVGDFDSATTRPPQAVETIYLSVDKDDTDMMVAIQEGFRRGCTQFHIFGGLGARLDHSYANFCALQYIAEQGGTGVLEDEDTRIFFLREGSSALRLENQRGKTVSVFPFGCPSCTVTYQGLRYPLETGTLTTARPMGISNVVEEADARIFLEQGAALVMLMKRVVPGEAGAFQKES